MLAHYHPGPYWPVRKPYRPILAIILDIGPRWPTEHVIADNSFRLAKKRKQTLQLPTFPDATTPSCRQPPLYPTLSTFLKYGRPWGGICRQGSILGPTHVIASFPAIKRKYIDANTVIADISEIHHNTMQNLVELP